MNQEQILGIVRHVLTAAGSIAVTKGLVDEGTLTVAVGAVVTLIGVVWSTWAKRTA